MKWNNKGTSLVELVIAVAIIGIIVGPFLLSFNQTMSINEQSDKLFVASQTAADTMENMKFWASENTYEQAKTKADEYVKTESDNAKGVAIEIKFIESAEPENWENHYRRVHFTITVTDINNTADNVEVELESRIQFFEPEGS